MKLTTFKKFGVDGDPKRFISIITKEVFDYYFLESDYTREDFRLKLKVSNRTFNNSYWYHYTREERVVFAGRKISKSQKRRNSNAVNTGKPRKLLDKEKLIYYLIENNRSVEWVAKKLVCAPQTVRKNIDYYKLDVIDTKNLPYFLGRSELLDLQKLDEFFGTNLLHEFKQTTRDVQSIEDYCFLINDSLEDLRIIMKKIKKNNRSYARDNNIPFTKLMQAGSILNHNVGNAFKDLGYDLEFEYELKGKFYDIRLIGYNILIEVDSRYYHNTPNQLANDKYKTTLAKNEGFYLVRLFSEKEKYPTIVKKVKLCLKNLVSNGLLQPK